MVTYLRLKETRDSLFGKYRTLLMSEGEQHPVTS